MAAVCTNIVNVSPPEKQAESKISKEQVLKAIHELKTLQATEIAVFLNLDVEPVADTIRLLTNAEKSTVLDICPSCKRFKTKEHQSFQFEKYPFEDMFTRKAIICTDMNSDGTRIKHANQNVIGDVPRLKPKAALGDQKP